MEKVVIKLNEDKTGVLTYNGNEYGVVYWDDDEEQYIFRPHRYISLDCDQLREIGDKIANANSYGI